MTWELVVALFIGIATPIATIVLGIRKTRAEIEAGREAVAKDQATTLTNIKSDVEKELWRRVQAELKRRDDKIDKQAEELELLRSRFRILQELMIRWAAQIPELREDLARHGFIDANGDSIDKE